MHSVSSLCCSVSRTSSLPADENRRIKLLRMTVQTPSSKSLYLFANMQHAGALGYRKGITQELIIDSKYHS